MREHCENFDEKWPNGQKKWANGHFRFQKWPAKIGKIRVKMVKNEGFLGDFEVKLHHSKVFEGF